MRGGVSDDHELFARSLFQCSFDAIPFRAEMVWPIPTDIPGGRPLLYWEMEGPCIEAQTGHEKANCEGKPHQREADRPIPQSPDAHVAHGLQADCIESGCIGSEIVENQKVFYQHAGH